MAVNYVTQKCTSCAGTKLEYIKELKAWRCAYCGTLIERHEQVDTMFTIKNVVRQSLLDVAYTRMDSAQKNLVECEKIDSRYIGTIIAEIAYEMNMIIHGNISQAEQRNMFALLKKNYTALNSISEEVTEEEVALYEFFDSSEIIGLLVLVYDSLKAEKRRDFIMSYLNPGEIYSLQLNTDLINYSLKRGNFEVFDKIIENVDNIDTHAVFKLILEKYPDSDQKRRHAVALAETEGTLSDNDVRYASDYLECSDDSIETKSAVAIALINSPAKPSIECLMKNVITKITDEDGIAHIFSTIMAKPLLDVEKYTIIDFAISDCSDSACSYILTKLGETGQYIEFTHKHFDSILRRDGDAETKKALVEVGLKFHVTEKSKEVFVSSYLCDIGDTPENRKALIPYLLSLVPMLSTVNVEKYLLRCTADMEMKSEVVKMIFAMKINKSFFNNTLNNYIRTSQDVFTVKKEVVHTLISTGLRISSDAILDVLLQDKLNTIEKVELFRLLKVGVSSVDDITNNYIATVSESGFDSEVFGELLSCTSNIAEKNLIRYVLNLTDLDAAKIGRVSKLCGMCYSKVSDIDCTISHNGRNISCNLAQAYIFGAKESEEVAVSVLSALRGAGGDVNADVDVSGIRMKIKKYIKTQKNVLDSKTKRLCTESRIL